jgi:Protein of unknown function (DUF1553)/Protein of unknown function (DUF1549)/Planctomycete cytochrome C
MRIVLAFACLFAVPALFAAEKPVDYGRDVQPILSDNCFHCHGPDPKNRKAGLRLDTQEGAFGKDKGPVAIVAGDSKKSELIRRLDSHEADEVMPPPKSNRKLTDAQKQILKRWVDEGAKYETHWAFRTPVRPKVPPMAPAVPTIRNPIDAFLHERLTKEGLKPAPLAELPKLLRRVSLDLTGLPPTPEEQKQFQLDSSPDVYEKAIARLMASPRYGERMVWEWLDAARYADTNGYQGDPTRAMWYWRDWAVDAFNANMRFDRFTIEQIAGDLLPKPTRDQLIATGFNRNHMINGEGGRIAEESRVDYVFDRVETVGTVWLGLTFNCCRCHDHKYDPLSQKDYYAFSAYFNSIEESGGGGNDGAGLANPTMSFPTPDQEKLLAELRAKHEQAKKDRDPLKAKADTAAPKVNPKDTVDAQLKQAQAWVDALKALKEADAKVAAAKGAVDALERQVVRTMIMRERTEPRETFVLVKGAYDKKAEKVGHQTPETLPKLPADAPKNRLALAKWLVSKEQPLTPRVVMNRLWQQFFGVGLVKTTEDFGLQGERPSHPELLDWLACEFVDSGWDLQHMIRLILTSHAYRQTSKVTPEVLEKDPENRLLARGPRGRMPSWMIRDQALFVGGLLVEKKGGPPVKGYQPEGIWEDATFGQIRYQPDTGEALYRRSLYQFWRRIVAPTMFFDIANRQNCVVKVARTNTPLHALTLMNDVTYVEASRALAQRGLLDKHPDDTARLADLFLRCTGRRPEADETKLLLSRLAERKAHYAAKPDEAKRLLAIGASKPDAKLPVADLAAWSTVCSILLNLDETITVE